MQKMTSLTPSLPVIPPEVFTVFGWYHLGVPPSYHRTSRGFGGWKPRVQKSKSWGTHHWGSKPESYVQGLGLLIYGQKIMCRPARLEKKMYRKKADIFLWRHIFGLSFGLKSTMDGWFLCKGLKHVKNHSHLTLVCMQQRENHSNWVFPKIGVPQNGWFIMENHIKMDDFGGATIFGNTHISWLQKLLHRALPGAGWRPGHHQEL